MKFTGVFFKLNYWLQIQNFFIKNDEIKGIDLLCLTIKKL